MKLSLTYTSWEYPRTKPILDGTIQPEDIELITTISSPAETFLRAFKFNEYDITEMSLGSFIIAKSRGEAPWLALPVFPCRIFFHTRVLCNKNSNIRNPTDLRGKKVAIAEYQMTAAVWLRGILQHEFGVKPNEINWYQSRSEHRIPISLPSDISLKLLPPNTTSSEMLLKGEIDSFLYAPAVNNLGVDANNPATLHNEPSLHFLFPDRKEEEKRYYRKTGIFPVNHIIVIKEEVLNKNPWIANSMLVAFQKAKQLCTKDLDRVDLASAPNLVWWHQAYTEQTEIFGKDPFPYGINANKKMVETLASYCSEQGLAKRLVKIEELFAPDLVEPQNIQ